MYEEAASLASSVIKQRGPNLSIENDFELYEAMEAAGMVLVQSLKQLSRCLPFLSLGLVAGKTKKEDVIFFWL